MSPQMPLELQQLVLPHLDVKSILCLARTSKDLFTMVNSHERTWEIIHAERFMHTLPPGKPEQSILVELRACARSLSEDHVQSLVQRALQESNYGFDQACLLGPMLSGGTGQEAEQVAQALDKIGTRFTGSYSSQEDADRHARGSLVIQVLCEIGETKHPEVYEPFLKRLRLHAEYKICLTRVIELREKSPDIPAFARDGICKALLSREDDNKTLLQFAFQMFLRLDQFSPDTQDFVFDRTKTFFDARGPLTGSFAKKELRTIKYSENRIAEKFPSQPEQRKKWNDLIEAACSAAPNQ
jgi:hypothetical protein